MADGNAAFALRNEAINAKALLDNMRDLLGDDAELIASTVEGETDLHEALSIAVVRYAELETLIAGLQSTADNIKARASRLEQQQENIRTAITAAMEAGQMKKFEHALALLSTKAVPPKALITNEADIPSKFWKPSDPKLDKKAVLDALKAQEIVPGAELSNGSLTVQIKLR